MRTHDDPHVAYRLLADAYTRPRHAVLRELIANAIDANVAVGSTEPVQVELFGPDHPDALVVTDTGVGMSTGELENNFAKVGRSTKTRDALSIGKYGIGAKSPHAVTDTFFVTTTKKGITTELRMHLDPVTGAPDNQVTDVRAAGGQSGTTVVVPLPAAETANKNPWDSAAAAVLSVIDHDLVRVRFGEALRPLRFTHIDDQADPELSTARALWIPNNRGSSGGRVIMDQISYALPTSMVQGNLNHLVFRVPSGSMVLTHTREQVKDIEANKAVLDEQYRLWREDLFGQIEAQWRTAATVHDRHVLTRGMNWNRKNIFHRDHQNTDTHGTWQADVVRYPWSSKREPGRFAMGFIDGALRGEDLLVDAGSPHFGYDSTLLNKVTVAARSMREQNPEINVILADRESVEEQAARNTVDGLPLYDTEAVSWIDVHDFLDEHYRRSPSDGSTRAGFKLALEAVSGPTLHLFGEGSTVQSYLTGKPMTKRTRISSQELAEAVARTESRTLVLLTAANYEGKAHRINALIDGCPDAEKKARMRGLLNDAVFIADPGRSGKRLMAELGAQALLEPEAHMKRCVRVFFDGMSPEDKQTLVDSFDQDNAFPSLGAVERLPQHAGLIGLARQRQLDSAQLYSEYWAKMLRTLLTGEQLEFLPAPSPTFTQQFPLLSELLATSTNPRALSVDIIDVLYAADHKAAGSTRKRRKSRHA